MDAKTLIALDADIVRESARSRDKNGFLNIKFSKLTRDQVAPYYGREIPGFESQGLDPDKVYYGWRHPEELQKALETFNGKPLLLRHHMDSADAPQTEFRVGTVGTSAKWEAPFITNALSVWDEGAIKAIEDGSLRDLSCGYRYRPDFSPGETPDGLAYDFIMRDIACNHVALVEEGRAPGCYVEDSLPEDMTMEEKKTACDSFEEVVRAALADAGIEVAPEAAAKIAQSLAAAMEKKDEAPAAPAAEDEEPEAAQDEDETAKDEEPEAAKDEECEDEDPEAAKDEDEPKSEGAMDAALKKAVDVATKQIWAKLSGISAAVSDVEPAVGRLNGAAYDSADAVYLDAVKQMGYAGPVKKSEARAVFKALRSTAGVKVGFASDAAPEKKSFLDKFLK